MEIRHLQVIGDNSKTYFEESRYGIFLMEKLRDITLEITYHLGQNAMLDAMGASSPKT